MLQSQNTSHFRPRVVLVFVAPNLILLLALTPILCNNALLSHAPLLPSATLMISLATRSASLDSFLLSAAARIHCIAVRLLCFTPIGTGIGREAPPPMTPRCWRILTSGATESITVVRYWIGERGRRGGGVLPRRGRVGVGWGGEAVRRVSRIIDMF